MSEDGFLYPIKMGTWTPSVGKRDRNGELIFGDDVIISKYDDGSHPIYGKQLPCLSDGCDYTVDIFDINTKERHNALFHQ